MKEKLSITIDEENVRQLEEVVEQGQFRNKSHVVEFAVVNLLKEIVDETQNQEAKGK